MEGELDIGLSADARALARALIDSGHDAVLVGGAVRDALLHRPVTDIDFVTDATPGQVTDLAQGSGWARSVYAVGERFGTVGVVLTDKRVVEVSRYRETAPSGPAVAARFSADAVLRDFTVNAMGLDLATGTLLDPVDGRADLGLGVLRSPGDPTARFAEDPLRTLRAARLAAELGFELEEETLAAARDAAPSLRSVAAERVRDELTKLLVSERPQHGLEVAFRTQTLAVVLPEVAALDGLEQPSFHDLDVLAHTFQTVDNVTASPVLRWAALLHDVGKGPTRSVEPDGRIRFFGHAKVGAELTETICRRMRMSNANTRAIVHLVAEHMRLGDLDPDNPRAVDRAVRKLDLWERGGEEEPVVTAEQVLELTIADFEATAHRHDGEAVRTVLERAMSTSRLRGTQSAVISPISGTELMKLLDIKQGEQVGMAKKAIESAIRHGELSPDDRDGALEIARNALQRLRGG